jgi:tryptophanase
MRPRDQYAEPYRIRMVEAIRLPDRAERATALREAGYNVFNLRSDDVYVDLLTDSGTGAMSDRQWGALMTGDEAYAGSRSFYELEASVRDITGYRHLVPTHQGRGAENILMTALVNEGDQVLGNMHFDTTEGHIHLRKAHAINLLADDGYRPDLEAPFKGDIDLAKLEVALAAGKGKVPFVLITVTCNNNGGQPVSMANIRAAAALCRHHRVPMFFDAARFAENAYFIREREVGYGGRSVADIAREMFSYGDGCTMSCKKDGLVNIGGFLAVNDERLYQTAVQWGITYEGFKTYGGMAGRDLAALAVGLREVVDPAYLEERLGQVAYLAGELEARGVPTVRPAGGHGVYVDARALLPHIPQAAFPGQRLVVELYLEGGVRAVELGTSAFAHRDPATGEMIYPKLELVRLAIPRRTYTDRHMDVVARAFEGVVARKQSLTGLKMVYEAPALRHFTARFESLA